MKLMMHVLKKNDRLKIDNEKISWADVYNKLEEESKEVKYEIARYRYVENREYLKNIIRETFDLIQICILILWKAHKQSKILGEDNLIQKINIEHKDKLISERGWIIETGIEIDIKE